MKRVLFSLIALSVAAVTTVAQEPPAPVKIGVFDAARLSEETVEGKAVQARLTSFRDKKQAELAALEKAIADMQSQLTTQSLSLSADKRAALEKDMQRKALELSQGREGATREMQMELQEAQGKFQEQLLAVVDQFGRDEGFVVILEKGLVAFASQSIDVTTALVDRFNHMVPAKSEPAAAATAPPAAPLPPKKK